MNKLTKSEWGILSGLLLLSVVPCVGGIFRLVEMSAGSGILPENQRIQSAPIPGILHILSATPYCILGAFQLLPSSRRLFPRWHRVAGRMLVCTGITAAISGLWMTHFYEFPEDIQGDLLYYVRLVVGLCMMIFILLGLTAVLDKRIVHHQAFMIRAYALGLGAGTQVIIAIPWLLSVGELSGLTRDIQMTLAWVINAAVAEWAIYTQRSRIVQRPRNAGAERPDA